MRKQMYGQGTYFQKKNYALPNWLPKELREYILDRDEKLVNGYVQKLTKEQFAWAKARQQTEDEIEKRLLTNPHMKQVWNRFKILPKEQQLNKMVEFLFSSIILYFEGVDRHISEDKKDDKEHVKALKKKVKNQIRNLAKTIEETDSFRGLHENKPSYLLILAEIEKGLLARINFSWKDIPPKTLTLGSASKAITSIKRMGERNYPELVLKKGLPLVFKNIFGESHFRMARVVSLVMMNKPVPIDANEQLRDQTRQIAKKAKSSKKR